MVGMVMGDLKMEERVAIGKVGTIERVVMEMMERLVMMVAMVSSGAVVDSAEDEEAVMAFVRNWNRLPVWSLT